MVNPHLPPGFRFHPTDEELILHYLKKKYNSTPCQDSIIADVDIYKFDPWDLPAQASFGEKEWYFFSPRDRKYPNGARPNRAAASGYWKATGTDKVIETSSPAQSRVRRSRDSIGVKKALVFYKGKPPKGVKTSWIMHEYRLPDASGKSKGSSSSSMRLDDWVLCRIYKKSNSGPPPSPTPTLSIDQDQEEDEEQFVKKILLANEKPLLSQKSTSLSNLLDAMDFSLISSFLTDNEDPFGFDASDQNMLSIGVGEEPFFSNCGGGTAPSSVMENSLKRQRTNVIEDELILPMKKFMSSCGYGKPTTIDWGENNFMNHQVFMSSHLQFQG